jgi:hypothetical protein
LDRLPLCPISTGGFIEDRVVHHHVVYRIVAPVNEQLYLRCRPSRLFNDDYRLIARRTSHRVRL